MAGFRRALICVLVLLTSHCYINAANTTVSTANTTVSTANTTLSTTDTTQPDSTTTTTSTTNSQITNQTTTERNNSQSSTTTQQTSTTVTNNPQTNTSISASTSNNQTITGVSVQNTSTTGGTASSPTTTTTPPAGSQTTAQTTLTVISSVIIQTLTRARQTTKATQSISLSTQNETTSQSIASETTSQSTVSATAPQSLVNVTAPQSILNETTSQSTVSATAPQSLVNVTTSQSSVNESTSTSIQNKSTSHRSVSELSSQFTSNSSGGSSTPTPTDVSANSSGVRRDTTSKSIELSTSETTTQTDRCRSSPCQNGGTCVNVVNTYNCNCKSGWEGKNCTVESDSCLTVDRNCTKPNERCVNKPGYQNFSCECLPKYYKKDGDCIKESLYKFELRYEEEYLRAYNDSTSTAYKDKVEKIKIQVKNASRSLISDVTVKSLRNGSVIAETFVTAKASQPDIEQDLNIANLNATKQNLTAADYCIDIYHDCDTVSTDCVPREKGFYCKCKEDFKAIPQTTKYCMDTRRKTCNYNVCKHQGTCAINGPEIVCSCTEERTGKYCQERVVKKSNYDRLVKIFIGVTAGLGSLTLFFFLALIVFCCTEKKDQKYSSASREPIDDDITIHNWMPSLPRPKIKPGSFADDSMEMNESQPIKRPTVRPQPGTDNPAFIPEADYDLDKYEGRHAINGKRNDYVYL